MRMSRLIRFGVEYRSESSYWLLMRLSGMSLCSPTRSWGAATRRPSPGGWPRPGTRSPACSRTAGSPVPTTRSAWSTRPRRGACGSSRGKRTKLYVDRKKASQSFFGALSLTTKKMRIYPIEGNQNAEQITLMMDRLARETDEGKKIAVVLDNARFHHAKALNDLYAPGQALERIMPIYMPPYAPDHNPTEHVWNAAKNNIANLRALAPENTFAALTAISCELCK